MQAVPAVVVVLDFDYISVRALGLLLLLTLSNKLVTLFNFILIHHLVNFNFTDTLTRRSEPNHPHQLILLSIPLHIRTVLFSRWMVISFSRRIGSRRTPLSIY